MLGISYRERWREFAQVKDDPDNISSWRKNYEKNGIAKGKGIHGIHEKPKVSLYETNTKED